MTFDIVTIFPDMVGQALGAGIVGRAIDAVSGFREAIDMDGRTVLTRVDWSG